MNATGYLEDDNLILFAMNALSQEESRTVARDLAGSADLRRRYADVQLVLGLYATADVEQVEVPHAGLERLMTAIAADRTAPDATAAQAAKPEGARGAAASRTVVQMPSPATRQQPQPAALAASPWLGWAIAALLLLTAGAEYLQVRSLRHSVETNSSQLKEANQTAADLAREREAIRQQAAQEASRANASVAELSNRSAQLSEQVDAASSRAEQERQRAAQLSARVSAESNRAVQANARASDLAAQAAANASERDQLQNSLNSQQDQLAQVGAQAVAARQVLDALSDPQALRVTLTVPKQKKTPSGRGTYVPSRGTLLFAGSNLPALRSGKVYELWLMPSDGSAPIPAGTFSPDAAGNATVVSTTFRRSIAAKGFAVTAEPAGGSQTPTLPILLAAS